LIWAWWWGHNSSKYWKLFTQQQIAKSQKARNFRFEPQTTLNAGINKCAKNLWATPKFRHQEGDIKQVSPWKPTNIRCHSTKFSQMDDVVPGICATLSACHTKCKWIMVELDPSSPEGCDSYGCMPNCLSICSQAATQAMNIFSR